MVELFSLSRFSSHRCSFFCLFCSSSSLLSEVKEKLYFNFFVCFFAVVAVGVVIVDMVCVYAVIVDL